MRPKLLKAIKKYTVLIMDLPDGSVVVEEVGQVIGN